MKAQVYLTIETRTKDIPYPASTSGGSQGFGFKPLKGKPLKVAGIKEVSEVPGVADLLRVINAKETPFFSVGCEKHIGPYDDGSFYVRGYVEFAFNHPEFLRDVQYMALFKHFNDYVSGKSLRPEWSVNWELQPAHFKKVEANGYTCCMWLHVRRYFTREKAVEEYNALARHLIEFFSAHKADKNRPSIY